MAFTKPTLATLKQSLADRHDSGTLPSDSATLSLWIRLFNRGVEYCINRLRLVKSTSLTTSSGTIALPDDFKIISSVVDANDIELTQIAQEHSSAAIAGSKVFWITGSFSGGYYLNTPEDATYTVYYTFAPSPMSSDSDVCPFPDEEAIVAYAYGMLRNSESNPFEDASSALAECDSRLREIKDQYQLNTQPLGFQLAAGSYRNSNTSDAWTWTALNQ